jgi:hypothetical protein
MNEDKTWKITLDNPSVRNEPGFHDMIECPNDPLCLIKLFQLVRSHFPDDWAGTILRRKASLKQLRMRPKDSVGFIKQAGLEPNDRWGTNYPNKVTKEVAKRIGLVNYGKHTAQSRRHSGITHMVSSKVIVPSSEVVTSARHKSALTNAMLV